MFLTIPKLHKAKIKSSTTPPDQLTTQQNLIEMPDDSSEGSFATH